MENFNLLGDLEPITLDELKQETSGDRILSSLFKKLVNENLSVSDYLSLDTEYIETLKQIHLNLYSITFLNKTEENCFIQNLPPKERDHLKSLRSIMSNLTLIEESISTKVPLFSTGENSVTLHTVKGF